MRLLIPRIVFGVERDGEFPRVDPAEARRRLERQITRLGEFIRQVWTAAAQRRNVRRTGAYLRGINEEGRITMEFESDGDVNMSGSVEVFNTAEHAHIVEDGHSAYHLPSVIDWSKGKIKRSKAGVRYMHVPFTHSAHASPERAAAQGLTTATIKSMMPPEVYNRAKRLAPTRQMRIGPQYGPDGQYKQADGYHGGGQALRVGAGPNMRRDSKTGALYQSQRGEYKVPGSGTNPAWATPKYEGLRRAKTRSGSRYYTIRTMTEDSQGWHIPAMAGKHVARDVATFLRSGPGRQVIEDRILGALQGGAS